MSDSVRPHGLQPTRLLCPWDSPGKNTGVGCHFLLQCMKVESESEVDQSLSRVWLLATPWTVAYQAPPSMEFPRQEYWSGLPLPSLSLHQFSSVAQSCPTLSEPLDCSLPRSSIHGIFQARVLEWGTIAFSASKGTGMQSRKSRNSWGKKQVWPWSTASCSCCLLSTTNYYRNRN